MPYFQKFISERLAVFPTSPWIRDFVSVVKAPSQKDPVSAQGLTQNIFCSGHKPLRNLRIGMGPRSWAHSSVPLARVFAGEVSSLGGISHLSFSGGTRVPAGKQFSHTLVKCVLAH